MYTLKENGYGCLRGHGYTFESLYSLSLFYLFKQVKRQAHSCTLTESPPQAKRSLELALFSPQCQEFHYKHLKGRGQATGTSVPFQPLHSILPQTQQSTCQTNLRQVN